MIFNNSYFFKIFSKYIKNYNCNSIDYDELDINESSSLPIFQYLKHNIVIAKNSVSLTNFFIEKFSKDHMERYIISMINEVLRSLKHKENLQSTYFYLSNFYFQITKFQIDDTHYFILDYQK